MLNNSEIKVIESKRGGKIILYDGYGYNIHKKSQVNIYWRCRKRSCKGFLITTHENIIERSIEHNHDRNYDENEALYLAWRIKNRSIETRERPREIIDAELNLTTAAISQILPSYNNMIDGITRLRRSGRILENDHEIPDNIRYTYSGELFVKHCEKEDGANSATFILFSTETHLDYLKISKNWYCDGTFRTCPSQYRQIYTIMGDIKGYNFPLVYFIMKEKSKAVYLKVLQKLKDLTNNYTPDNITIDFEMAAFLAIKEIYPQTQIMGCFFHFTQILYRKIQNNGQMNEYKRNPFFREAFKMVIALSTVPLSALEEESKKLESLILRNNNLNSFVNFWLFFKQNYLKNLNNPQLTSIFSVEFWSIRKRLILSIPRTTNALEGFHRALNANIISNNPTLYEIGMEFKKQQAISENKTSRLFFKERKIENDKDKKAPNIGRKIWIWTKPPL